MKKIKLLALLLITLSVFTLGISAQRSEATAKALDLMTQGKFKDAIAALDKAVEKNRDLFAVYKLRGTLKRMTGDFEGALTDFSAAIEQKADDGEVYEHRAMMRLYTRKDPALILADLDAAISYGRKHERVYATRGAIKSKLRDFEGAVADYETAIGMRPEAAGAYLGLSGVYAMMRNEQKSAEVLENFIEHFESSETKPEWADGRVVATSGANKIPVLTTGRNTAEEGSVIIQGRTTTGKTYSSDGSPNANPQDGAFQMEQKKNTASIYSALASVYERRQDHEKASGLVEKALAIDPDDFMALTTRGRIRTAAGNYAAAIGDFDAALRIMPNFSQVYLNRGVARMLSGNEPEAQKDFDKFVELVPNGRAIVDSEIRKAKEKVSQ